MLTDKDILSFVRKCRKETAGKRAGMVSQHIMQQKDFILFVYSFSFIALSIGSMFLARFDIKFSVPWKWMSLFGLSGGIATWGQMLLISRGYDAEFYAWYVTFLIIPQLFLIEFSRAASVAAEFAFIVWIALA